MDLEAIKSRLNAMQKTSNGNGGGDRTSLFWKPTVGKQTVRVVPSTTSGASSARVYSAVAVGKEALLEANVYDVQTVVAPQIDILRRKSALGWKYFGGWGIFRDAAVVRLETGGSAL